MPQPFERIIALDFETAWDSKSYTLSRSTTEEYLRDPRFKAWGCAHQFLDEIDARPRWVTGSDLPRFFKSIDWSTTAALAHNSQFDVSILSWKYGHVPCFIFDTLSMARALYGVEVGNSLAKLAAFFNLPPKGNSLYSTDGILDKLPAKTEEELARYCEHDTALCIAIFDKLAPRYPTKELRLIDMTLRMFVTPTLQLDKQILIDAIFDEKEKREELLCRLGIKAEDLASNDKFATLLRSMNVTPPLKISKTTGKQAYAFAKNDALFQALVNHDQEEIALLCEARMLVKSTLERTRAQRFLDIARRGALPVPLSYYAAHTGRYGGSKGSALNMQNLKRGSFLRKAICAPERYVFVAIDLSQIEARIVAWLANDGLMLQAFTSGEDIYATFGARMFGVPGMTQASHPELRQSAKSAVLGCNYGLGWANFAAQLLTGFLGAPPMLYGINMAKQLGIHAIDVEYFVKDQENVQRMRDIPRTCSNDELAVHCTVSHRIINSYRQACAPVVGLWRVFDDYIQKCLVKNNRTVAFAGPQTMTYKCLTFTLGQIVLPNGMALRYPDIQGTPDAKGRMQWTYDAKDSRKKLYGSKVLENVTQAIARIVMTDGMLRGHKRYPCKLSVHDEAVFLVPETEVEEGTKWLQQQMLVEPKYLPGIPLRITTGIGQRYGECK